MKSGAASENVFPFPRCLVLSMLPSDYRAIHEREDGNATSALQGTLRQVETPYIVCMLSHFSCVQLFVTLWIVAHQAPLSIEFSRQEYLVGCHFPPPGDLSHPGIKPVSNVSPA